LQLEQEAGDFSCDLSGLYRARVASVTANRTQVHANISTFIETICDLPSGAASFLQVDSNPTCTCAQHPKNSGVSLMPKLLRIDVSPRGDWSISKKVATAVEAAWTQKFSGEVITRDISKGLPIVDMPWIAGAYCSPDQRTEEHKQSLALSNELIAELKAADHILIAAPFWNFTLPAALVSYLDQIVRINETFTAKYEGLVTGKKMMVVRASGGAYGTGTHMAAMNNFDKPLTDLLKFIGITDISIYAAENTTAIMTGAIPAEQYVADHSKAAIAALLG
jgi:FMN-dependent NADH-azoreductase